MSKDFPSLKYPIHYWGVCKTDMGLVSPPLMKKELHLYIDEDINPVICDGKQWISLKTEEGKVLLQQTIKELYE